MEERWCANCRFSELVDEDNDLYRCARYPPKIRIVEGKALSLWPQILGSELCGEWAQGEEK